eukprot:scaffold492237_cov27-Prasinocladus_malaysianus.AAC.1
MEGLPSLEEGRDRACVLSPACRVEFAAHPRPSARGNASGRRTLRISEIPASVHEIFRNRYEYGYCTITHEQHKNVQSPESR